VLVSGNGRPRGDGVAADRSRPADDPVAVANAPIVRPQPADAPDRAQILREKLDAITGVRPSAPSEPVPRSTTPSSQRHDRPAGPTSHRPAEAMPTSTRYVVRPGDTLSRIAAAQYGSQGQQFINGIADANRGAVTNPDVIRVGMELVLPPIDGVAPAAAPVRRGDSPRVTEPPVEAAPVRNKSFRWYQIRENDRYVSIAREQLGDSGRWKEIYELNKDKFPDPAFIRAGVRIKLPADEVAAKPPGRRH
jgi:nucleoid-associated protein YgaU